VVTNPATAPNPDADRVVGRNASAKGYEASKTPRRRPMVYLNDIHVRACQKWREAGQPPGDGSRFWLEAEHELLREKMTA